MSELNELHTNEDLEQALEKSLQHPILMLKHSTRCPVSARAFTQYKSFVKEAFENIDCYLVKVIQDRSVSKRIEEQTAIKHESPQIFLINKKEVVWHTSHAKITVDNIKEALENVAK